MLDRRPYDRFRVSPTDPSKLRCADVERTLESLAASSDGRLSVEKNAESFQGQPIYLATIGGGPRRVLLWSQMHGDESTHTAVLVDLLSFLLQQPADAAAEKILSGCTLFALPMLNPDGAELGIRFNAQQIDVNRDSLRLETPEGRALWRAVETLKPEFGFNLHNQNARAGVGNPAKPIALAVSAPPADVLGAETAQIIRAKQVAACIVNGARPRIEGMVARYVCDYMPWSFGEAIQTAGVTTVLVEAGGWPESDPTPMVEVHFDGLVAALHAIATDTYRDVDPKIYDELPAPNEWKMFDCILAGGHVLDGFLGRVFRADVAINYSNGTRLFMSHSSDGKIADIGDFGSSGAKETIDATGCLIVPAAANMVAALVADTASPASAKSYGELVADTWKTHQVANRAADHGRIARDFVADLLVFKCDGHVIANSPVDWRSLQRVLVAGETVWIDGAPIEKKI